MDKILPNQSNIAKEIEQLNKHNKRIMIFNYAIDVLMIIVGISVLIMIWLNINNMMQRKAYDEGYERGYEQSSWDYTDYRVIQLEKELPNA